MIHLVMKDYKTGSAKADMQKNAQYWSNYLFSHSGALNFLNANHKKLAKLKKILAVLIIGVNWQYYVYQPRHNKLLTNLVKQQYLTIDTLRLFVGTFMFYAKTKHLTVYADKPLLKNQLRTIDICIHLYREYKGNILPNTNLASDLDVCNYVLMNVIDRTSDD